MAGQLDQDDGERLEAVRGGEGHEHTRGFHNSRPTEPRVEATAAPPRLSFRAPRRRETLRQSPPSHVSSHSARCAIGPGPARRKCAARGGHRWPRRSGRCGPFHRPGRECVKRPPPPSPLPSLTRRTVRTTLAHGGAGLKGRAKRRDQRDVGRGGGVAGG